jgi:hypothetical protein
MVDNKGIGEFVAIHVAVGDNDVGVAVIVGDGDTVIVVVSVSGKALVASSVLTGDG